MDEEREFLQERVRNKFWKSCRWPAVSDSAIKKSLLEALKLAVPFLTEDCLPEPKVNEIIDLMKDYRNREKVEGIIFSLLDQL